MAITTEESKEYGYIMHYCLHITVFGRIRDNWMSILPEMCYFKVKLKCSVGVYIFLQTNGPITWYRDHEFLLVKCVWVESNAQQLQVMNGRFPWTWPVTNAPTEILLNYCLSSEGLVKARADWPHVFYWEETITPQLEVLISAVTVEGFLLLATLIRIPVYHLWHEWRFHYNILLVLSLIPCDLWLCQSAHGSNSSY